MGAGGAEIGRDGPDGLQRLQNPLADAPPPDVPPDSAQRPAAADEPLRVAADGPIE